MFEVFVVGKCADRIVIERAWESSCWELEEHTLKLEYGFESTNCPLCVLDVEIRMNRIENIRFYWNSWRIREQWSHLLIALLSATRFKI